MPATLGQSILKSLSPFVLFPSSGYQNFRDTWEFGLLYFWYDRKDDLECLLFPRDDPRLFFLATIDFLEFICWTMKTFSPQTVFRSNVTDDATFVIKYVTRYQLRTPDRKTACRIIIVFKGTIGYHDDELYIDPRVSKGSNLSGWQLKSYFALSLFSRYFLNRNHSWTAPSYPPKIRPFLVFNWFQQSIHTFSAIFRTAMMFK